MSRCVTHDLPAPYVAVVEEIASYWSRRAGVDALLLAGSWARERGDAANGSDIDLVLLYDERFPRPAEWAAFTAWLDARRVRWNLGQLGPYSDVEVAFHDGRFIPSPRTWTSGPDAFELEIGNVLAYTRPVVAWTDRLSALRGRWQPYYDESLRQQRLVAAVGYARNNLEHIPPYSARGLLFQCLKRLHHALEETLQALFIAARRYPIAYDKWIEEQVCEILGRPDLYATFVQVVTIPALTAATLQDRARLLTAVLAAELPLLDAESGAAGGAGDRL